MTEGSRVAAADLDRVDGRRVRRERNRDAVLDAVLEMFAEEQLVPSIEQAAERSGLSLRSVYRYFPDPDALTRAVIDRQLERVIPLARLHAIGKGPLDARLTEFARMRVNVFEHVGPTFRASRHHESHNVQIRQNLHRTRRLLSDQFERQFEPELDSLAPEDREKVAAAADQMSQFDALDVFRRHRGLTVPETEVVLECGLRALLTAADGPTGGRVPSLR